MKATEAKLLDFLKKSPQFVIPIYQRTYSWTDLECRQLFEALRKEIFALDPCVSEVILKLYIAYKAETNFVDVVPQIKQLRLSLNMEFHELHDPKGLAKDVTNLGRWGNGDVEVGLNSSDEISYVMGLVRQAFEKQMGNGVEQ